jgi:hypothetical protein
MPLAQIAAGGDRDNEAGARVRPDLSPRVLGDGVPAALREVEQQLSPLPEDPTEQARQQQAKGLQADQPELGEEVARDRTSIKHFLWHGNTFQALQRSQSLLCALEFAEHRSPLTKKLAKGVREFDTCIRNSEELIPDFGERYRMGETITTAFVESTVNQVISKRPVRKRQMQGTPRGAHLLLQVRTKVINGELDDVFRRWHPRFRPAAAT